jgi:hypothetical protein
VTTPDQLIDHLIDLSPLALGNRFSSPFVVVIKCSDVNPLTLLLLFLQARKLTLQLLSAGLESLLFSFFFSSNSIQLFVSLLQFQLKLFLSLP